MIIGGITMICPNCHNNNDNDSIYFKKLAELYYQTHYANIRKQQELSNQAK